MDDFQEHDRNHDQGKQTNGEEESPQTYEDFWRSSINQNDEKLRDAGKDPYEPLKEPFGKHGTRLKRGLPQDDVYLCYGCAKTTTAKLECCQCLEIFRERASCAANDDWERAFFCSNDCYIKHWEEHKERHGPSTSGPTKLDSRIHQFEAAKGYGALWDSDLLKRLNFAKCVPIW